METMMSKLMVFKVEKPAVQLVQQHPIIVIDNEAGERIPLPIECGPCLEEDLFIPTSTPHD